MKHTLFIFALITASIQTFAQSPRIKLNQITKDSVTGSVLISSPTDSGMVYSRDLFISYGVSDTVLILGGDTISGGGGLSSVLSDGVTITGDGTIGSELTADTSVLATLRALSDSLALVISSVTADGVTITGDGTVGSPLTVDTATVIATVGRLLDSLVNVRTDLDLKQDQLNGTGFVKATGTTISYDNSTYLTSEVDGSVTNEGSLTVGAGTASTSVISSNTSGSTDVTLTAGTNVTLSETGNNITISSTGGGTTYNNISETADTVYISDYLDVDTSTLYVNANNNRVGIGTSSPSFKFQVVEGGNSLYYDGTRLGVGYGTDNIAIGIDAGNSASGDNNLFFGKNAGKNITSTARANAFFGPNAASINTVSGDYNMALGYTALYKLSSGEKNVAVGSSLDEVTTGTGNVGIGFIAGRAITTGSNNTYIGTQADGSSGTVTNEIAIGYNADGQGSNTVAIGNTSITSIEGQVSFTTYSDARDKKNINDLSDGLNIVKQLRPVKFTWETRDGGKIGVNDIGFIAQEVDGVQFNAKDVDYINIVNYNSVSDKWRITYDKFTPIIVKAIQEQQSIIESQASEIETLKTLITDLSNRLTILENK